MYGLWDELSKVIKTETLNKDKITAEQLLQDATEILPTSVSSEVWVNLGKCQW